ncbi:MAG: hypothetical protein OEY93_03510 [Anaerolineae bacterium]|nr:hypothetical protein [Anaerolineae bacterium]
MAKNKILDWMMWQIDDGQAADPPELNLIRAIQYYNEKYGLVPNRLEVSQKWAKQLTAPTGIVVTRSRSIPPGQLMLALDPDISETLPGKRPA